MKATELMEEALLQLIERKDYEKITVTDLVKRAGVTRVTFYRNFESKDDILRQLLKRAFDDFLKKYPNNHSLPVMFRFFETNKRLIAALFESKNEIMIAQLLTDEDLIKQANPEISYSLATVGYLFLGACSVWYQRGMVDTAEEIENIMQKQNKN